MGISRKRFGFKTMEIWFSDHPYDIDGYHSVIFYACKNKTDISGFRCKEFTTLTIDLRQDLSTIWGNIDKSNCQYGIRRAKREGIRIKRNEGFNQFFALNRAFREKKGLPPILNELELKKYGTLFTADLNGEIIAGQLYFEDNDNIRWLITASNRLEVNKQKATLISCANRLLIWEAINYAKEKGIKEFDFGGYYTGKEKDEQLEGINFFKAGFGGKLNVQYICQKDCSRFYEFARWIYKLRARL